MNYRVTETFLKGRNKDITLCEDGFIVTDDYAVMIDGAGTPSPMVFKGHKGGRYIMELIRDSITEYDGDLNYLSFLERMNESIIETYKREGFYESLKSDINLRPMASVLVYSKLKNQLWFYGDCKALVDGKQITNNKYIDEVMLNARKMVLEGELLLGKSEEDLRVKDVGREYINTLLSYQRLFLHNRNGSPLAFSSVDGFDFLEDTIKVVDLPEKIRSLVLSSDGYAVLKPTLEETEVFLHKQLEEDVLAIGDLLGFKTHELGTNSVDDRAYVRLIF